MVLPSALKQMSSAFLLAVGGILNFDPVRVSRLIFIRGIGALRHDAFQIQLTRTSEYEERASRSCGPTYFTVPIDEKKGFAEVVNCVLLKGAGGGIAFDLVQWQTGKRVASWNGYRLDVD